MSGRIRTIKPELLEDERVAKLTHAAFRLFIGLILVADDYGNFRANPDQLRGAIFWGRAPDDPKANEAGGIDALLAEVSRPEPDGAPGLVTLYEAKSQRYGHLEGWAKHQRVHHPGLPRVPGPKDGKIVDVVADSGESPEPSGESRESLRPDPIRSDPITTTTTAPREGVRRDDPVETVFAYYAEARQRATGSSVLAKLTSPRRKLIKARMGEGYSVDDLKAAVRGLFASPFHMGENDRNTKYIDPEHVFREAKQVERLAESGRSLKDPEPSPAPIEGVVTDPEELSRIRRRAVAGIEKAARTLFDPDLDDETGPSASRATRSEATASSDVVLDPPNGPGADKRETRSA